MKPDDVVKITSRSLADSLNDATLGMVEIGRCLAWFARELIGDPPPEKRLVWVNSADGGLVLVQDHSTEADHRGGHAP